MNFNSFDDSWKFWIWDNVKRGSPKRELAGILLEKGFKKELIINEFGIPDIFEVKNNAPELDVEKILANTKFPAKRLSDKLNIFEIKNVFNEEECAKIIEVIRANCTKSSVIDYQTGGNTLSDFRTSSTTNLYRNKYDIVNLVEDRIFSLINIPEKFTEQIQGQFYKEGEQFKPHFDTLFPNSEFQKKEISSKGNRTWTAMVYLNDTPKGGHTKFTKIDYESKPELGKMILWQNTKDGENIQESMHWGMPVEEGEKFVLTKWFRENIYQPALDK